MTISPFVPDYPLPGELIASFPAEKRDASRLMVLSRGTGKVQHEFFRDLPSHLRKGDAIVLNETRVVPARVFGRTPNGKEYEFLFIRFEGGKIHALVRGLKKMKAGKKVDFGNGLSAVFAGPEGGTGVLITTMGNLTEWLEKNGHVPLPPYIPRNDLAEDRERYQTVFAAKNGSCAAPTAGLHFTPELLEEIGRKGVRIFKVCLHVGPGTFRPIGPENRGPSAEYAEVEDEVYRELLKVKKEGGRVVAVGTTSARALETAALKGGGFTGPTDLFIEPGFDFKMVDALVTNFHLPRSSLLSLVCAFAGTETTMAAYRTAIDEKYRFYSYGDAMLLE